MKEKYYSLSQILKKNATYNVIFGERSNGKTYAVLKYAIQRFFSDGSQLAIIRRWREDFVGKRGQTMFDALTENREIEKLSDGRYNAVYYFSSRWYMARVEDGKTVEKSEFPFAYGFALTSGEHDKSTSYPLVKTVLFDEFLTRTAYVPDEFVLFMNTLSTIIRDRGDVQIFMLGNTVNKYCPYFAEMGLKHVKDQKQGTIDTYTYGNKNLTVAVEYCDPRKEGKLSDKYFAFDNPKLAMITGGEWEIAVYPHIPYRYIPPKNVLYTFYIIFSGDALQCVITDYNGENYICVSPVSVDFPRDETTLIYTTDFSTAPNLRRNLYRAATNAEKRIVQYFKLEKVFYSDNETGEVMRNYLNWCSSCA